MKTWRVFAVCCVVAFIGGNVAAGEKADEKALKKLQGNWNVVRAEKGGQKIPNDDVTGLTLKIKDNKMIITLPDGSKQNHTFKIQSKFMPALIDITQEGKDEKLQGIYKLDKKNLYICVIHGGQNRPAAFSTTNDNDAMLVVFERVPE